MYIKGEDLITTTRENSHGGNGIVYLKNLMFKETMPKHARLVSVITLESGNSLGLHKHEKEVELYYILEGEATIFEGETSYKAQVGDVIITGNGGSHAIENQGKEELKFLAIVFLED